MRKAILSLFFGLAWVTTCYAVCVSPPVSVSAVDAVPISKAAEVISPHAVNRTTPAPVEIDLLDGNHKNIGSHAPSQSNFHINYLGLLPRRVELPHRDGEEEDVVYVPNGVRLYSKWDYRNYYGCEMRNSGNVSALWWLTGFRPHFKDSRAPVQQRAQAQREKQAAADKLGTVSPITIADAQAARDEFIANAVVSLLKIVGFLALLPLLLVLTAVGKVAEFFFSDEEPSPATVHDLPSIIATLNGEVIEEREECAIIASADALVEEIRSQQRTSRKLLLGITLIVAGLLACDAGAVTGLAMTPTMIDAAEQPKARRLGKRVLRSVEALRTKIARAQQYRIFPTLTVIGEGHGSQASHTLRGTNPRKKALAPKVLLSASGQNGAAIIRNIPEVNARRKAAGKEEWEVGVADIIFTEFRNSSPRSIVDAMRVMNYFPAGPGCFVRLGDNTEYNEWILEVCRTAKDLRSYGRSHTTSPVLEHISPDIAVHFVSLKEMGIDTDGSSYITQGISGILSAAFQIRMVSTPSDLWVWCDMMAGIIKGLVLQAKIVKNVTTGEAEWVDKILWEKLLKTDFQDENCPIVEVEGTKYQAGLFIDTSNMAKCDLKKPIKELADGAKVTTVSHQEHFISFIIAEQFAGRTSIGWQTLQLIPKVILEKHSDALRGKVSSKLQRYLDGDFSESFTDKLSRKFNGLAAIPSANLKAINLMAKLSGKATLRMVFGGGLSGQSDYVLEMGDLPAGYVIHNGPKKARDKAGSHTLLRMMMSRYPQQGFESLLYLKVLSATQVGELYNWYVMEEQDDQSKHPCKAHSDLDAFVKALDAKVESDHERFKLVLTAMKCSLPFVKAGCAILSHDDQFGRLRGDADGDKNFWSYDKTLVAIVREMDKVTKTMRLPRLEIDGSGMQIHPAFDDGPYLELCKSAAKGEKPHTYRKVANLLCAANNGQGPVGLIANFSTVPLSRLKWSIEEVDGEDRLVWANEASQKLFAYLLLMQQTAIDMQKRIYPPMSLLHWTYAKLFANGSDDAEALTAPSRPGATDGHYMSLGEDEKIWSMSTQMHMHIPAYMEGLMYNEKALGHWLAWVVNGIIFDFDFLGSDQTKIASEVLHREGVDAFFNIISEASGVDVSKLEAEWLFVEDLTSWKSSANLEELKGSPAEGIEFIWNMVIDVYSDLKKSAGLSGSSPMEHLAKSCTAENREEATRGIVGTHTWNDSDGKVRKQKFHLILSAQDCIKLFGIFAKLTDQDSKEIAESERQQGDKPKDPSEMKAMLRMMFDDSTLRESVKARYQELTSKNTPKGSAIPMGLLLNKLFSNESNWSPVKRREVLLALCRALHSNMVVLAADGGAASISDAVKILTLMRKIGLLKDKGFDKVRPESILQEKWEFDLEKNEGWINHFSRTWASESSRGLRKAVKTYGWPQIIDKGDLGLAISGSGFPKGGMNRKHLEGFLEELASYNKRPKLLQVAEWLADSVWPVMGLVWELCDEQVSRQALLGDSAILEEDSVNVSYSNVHLYTQDVVKKIALQRINLKKLLIEAMWDIFPGSDKASHLLRYHLMGLIDSHDEEELFLVGDDDLQLLLRTVSTARFQRKVVTQLRPIMACARVKDWLERWHAWGATADPDGIDQLSRDYYVNSLTFKAMFNSTFEMRDGEVVLDAQDNPVEKRRWLKSRVEMSVPSRFQTEFFHSILMGEDSANGLYILCPESRAKGRYSIGRWVYFDGLTYRLAIKNMVLSGKKKSARVGEKVMRFWLAAHMEEASPLTLGMAYHSIHYRNIVEKWIGSWGDDDGINIPFVGLVNKPIILAGIEAVDKFLQGYEFSFSLKEGKKETRLGVFLPMFFGCNNKLTGIGDFSQWFLSSKLWMTLISFGDVDFDKYTFDYNKRVFEAVWGVKYPTKRQASMADLGDTSESAVQAKQPLPWFQTRVDPAEGKALIDLVDKKGFAPTEFTIQGMPSPQQCIELALSRFVNERSPIDPAKVSPHKAICAFLGLSSVEYQFENLKKGSQSEFHKAIARSWSGISVSGLRDLFGGLGEYSGWSVRNTHYIGHVHTLSVDTLRVILKEFWKGDEEAFDKALKKAQHIVKTSSASIETDTICSQLEKRRLS